MTDDVSSDVTSDPTSDVTDDRTEDRTEESTDVAAAVPAAVEVRRNVLLSAATGGVAARAGRGVRAFARSTGGTLLDWVAFAVLAAITLLHVAAVVDGRAPLLVADEHGVRLRKGASGRASPGPEVECLEHLPRRRFLRDGHLLVVGYDDQQLIVPLTMATTLVGATRTDLSDVLAALADGRADVVEVVPGLAEEGAGEAPAEDSVEDTSDDTAEDTAGLPVAAMAAARSDDTGEVVITTADDTVDTGPILAVGESGSEAHSGHDDALDDDTDDDTDDADTGPIGPRHGLAGVVGRFRGHRSTTPDHTRSTVLAARSETHRSGAVHDSIGANALRLNPEAAPIGALPEAGLLRRTDEEADAHEATVVLQDVAVQPADEPAIGPLLAAARERLRLTVDQLSERTRVRPHVIEAIEVDDFAPCGGDFYARGHLRTLARVLGIEAGPLIATYDERYAHAPVDPRRVFESELATGAGGTIRGTRGGRNWSVLVASVMAAVLVWSIAQLVMGGPVELSKPPVLNQSGGLPKAGAGQADPIAVTLTAAGGGAEVVVRDASGDLVFDGNLAFGQTSELKVVPPVRIWTSDGSVTAAIGADDAKPLGETGAEVNKTLVAP